MFSGSWENLKFNATAKDGFILKVRKAGVCEGWLTQSKEPPGRTQRDCASGPVTLRPEHVGERCSLLTTTDGSLPAARKRNRRS